MKNRYLEDFEKFETELMDKMDFQSMEKPVTYPEPSYSKLMKSYQEEKRKKKKRRIHVASKIAAILICIFSGSLLLTVWTTSDLALATRLSLADVLTKKDSGGLTTDIDANENVETYRFVAEDLKTALRIIPELKEIGYIPEGYEFKSLDITKTDDDKIYYSYTYNMGIELLFVDFEYVDLEKERLSIEGEENTQRLQGDELFKSYYPGPDITVYRKIADNLLVSIISPTIIEEDVIRIMKSIQ